MWTPQKPTLFDGHYLCNRSTLDIGVLGYIGIVQHKEHSPEVLSITPGTPCILAQMRPVVVNKSVYFPRRDQEKLGSPFQVGKLILGSRTETGHPSNRCMRYSL